MQDKSSQLENSKMELEKQLMGLQAEVDQERRDCNLKTETISDLQGESWWSITTLTVTGSQNKSLQGYLKTKDFDRTKHNGLKCSSLEL